MPGSATGPTSMVGIAAASVGPGDPHDQFAEEALVQMSVDDHTQITYKASVDGGRCVALTGVRPTARPGKLLRHMQKLLNGPHL